MALIGKSNMYSQNIDTKRKISKINKYSISELNIDIIPQTLINK